MSHWKKPLGHPPWCRRLPWRALRLCQEPLDPLGKTNLPGLPLAWQSVRFPWNVFSITDTRMESEPPAFDT